jgi:hypothetical protein
MVEGAVLDGAPSKPDTSTSTGALKRYRELWTVDVSDGSVRRTQRCEHPVVSGDVTGEWSGGPCADNTPLQ